MELTSRKSFQLSISQIQFLCLIFAGLTEGLILLLGPFANFYIRVLAAVILNIDALFFVLISLQSPLSRAAKKLLITGALISGWVFFLQILGYFQPDNPSFPYPRFIRSAYLLDFLLCLPFASLADQDNRLTGIRSVFPFYLISTVIISLLCFLLLIGHLPSILQSRVRGSVLSIYPLWNPNMIAPAFFASIFFLFFSFFTRKDYGLKFLLFWDWSLFCSFSIV